METIQETCNKKAQNTIRGIHRVKETQKKILITGQLLGKERIIVTIAQEFSMGE